MDFKRVKSEELLEQRVSFDGMNYYLSGSVRVPLTDIDGIMEAHGKCWIIYECKHGDSQPPLGQKITLERLKKDITSSGKPVAVIVCSHNVPKGEKVYLKDCIVTSIYVNGKWIDPIKEYGKGYTAKSFTDAFLSKYAPEMIIKW